MTAAPDPLRRVRLWLGEYLIADYRTDPAQADRYTAAMQRLFGGLRVTVDDLPDDPAGRVPQLPAEQLWPLTAK